MQGPGPCGKRGCGAEASGGKKAAQVSATRIWARFQKKTARERDEGEDGEEWLWTRTPMTAEGPLVPKRRKCVGDGLDKVECGSPATSGCLEGIQETRVRSAKVLFKSVTRTAIDHGPDE